MIPRLTLALISISISVCNSSTGSFLRPLVDEETQRCVGVKTKDGTSHYAERVVMATGAWTPGLVDLEGQCVSKVSSPPFTLRQRA